MSLAITDKNLERFKTWMLGRGRGEDTVRIYCSHLRSSATDPKGLTHRLVGKLAPKTKRTNLAALAAWARFAKDDELRAELEEIRLPPARRMTAKFPLAVADWKKYVQHLRDSKMPTRDYALRQVMVIVAIRGLRCSDALRIRKREINAALATGKLVFEGKRGKRTEFAAAPMLRELTALSEIPGQWDYVREVVCPDSSSPARTAANRVWRRMKSEAAKVGISGVYPHQLRRTYATNYLEQLQGDPRAIIKLQKHMDWESMATAASYADAVDSSELDQVGERMLDGLLK
jgi:integrase